MQISEELPVGHLHYGKWTEDRRPKQFGTLTTLIPSGNADLSGFLKFYYTAFHREHTAFHGEKILQSLGYDSSREIFESENIKCRFFLCVFVVKKDGRPIFRQAQ